MVTYRQLQHDPETSGNDAEILAPSLESANASRQASGCAARSLTQLDAEQPHSGRSATEKIAALRAASHRLGAALNRKGEQPAAERPGQHHRAAKHRRRPLRAAGNESGAAADAARQVSDLLKRLAGADAGTRAKAEAAIVPPLIYDLDLLRRSLAPELVTVRTLPQDLVREWLLPDGRARVAGTCRKAIPTTRGAARISRTAVLRAEPSAAGGAISLL